MNRLESLILNRKLVRSAKSLRIIFTPLYGTGGVIIEPMLERLGFNVRIVEAQNCFDGNFPTVDSPNPENAAALRLGVELAKKEAAAVLSGPNSEISQTEIDRALRQMRTKWQKTYGLVEVG